MVAAEDDWQRAVKMLLVAASAAIYRREQEADMWLSKSCDMDYSLVLG